MKNQDEQNAIDVSITLLTRNAGPLLDRVLAALQAQETARVIELVAVDSGSDDGTVERLTEAGARVTSIDPDAFDFGRTRDQVFESARGAIVVCLSQDAVPGHARWLEHLVQPLDDPDTAASCGRSQPDPERSYAQFAWERNGRFYFTREMRTFAARYGRGLSNANAAIRRTVWDELRFGQQPTGEDFRFQTKLQERGYTVAFPDDAAVLHHHAYDLSQLYKRCRNEGLGLRCVGCGYGAGDLLCDVLHPKMAATWLRELVKGRLRTPAALLFPWVRPVAVYLGSRFGREYLR